MRNPTRSLTLLAVPAALAALLGCGGGGSDLTGSSATTGSALAYTNPSYTTSQFALVKDTSASTASTLVLDLVGPPTVGGCGVAFAFTANTSKVAWGTVSNGTVFTTGTPVVDSWAKNGQLQGVVSNKGLANSVSAFGTGVLARIPVTLASGALTGDASLADAGLGTLLDGSGAKYSFAVQVGGLSVR